MRQASTMKTPGTESVHVEPYNIQIRNATIFRASLCSFSLLYPEGSEQSVIKVEKGEESVE